MGTGRAVVRVVTVRGWRNWRMLGLHPGETLITLLPTFCCSVPRGVFFFFSSVLLAVVFLISEELSVALYQKKGCFSFWVGGVAYVENFPFLLSPLWQLATCLFLWGHFLSPERHIVSRTSAACRITGASLRIRTSAILSSTRPGMVWGRGMAAGLLDSRRVQS